MFTKTLGYFVVKVTEETFNVPHAVFAMVAEHAGALVFDFKGRLHIMNYTDLWSAAMRAGNYRGRVTIGKAASVQDSQQVKICDYDMVPSGIFDKDGITLEQLLDLPNKIRVAAREPDEDPDGNVSKPA